MTKSSGSPIEFRYDAAGNRVEKKQGTAITRYIRDASGNVMAVYQNNVLTERPIYGSSRLGQLDSASAPGYRRVGLKRYELSNHLGNVLAVVSDRIRMKTDSTWTQVLSRTDYYPFGLEMTGRTESATYRYGFNGKEKDPSGQWSNQTHYDYGFRIYNPAIGKFLSVDPLTGSYPMLTPYQFAGNNPTRFIDLDGLEVADPFPDAYYRNAPKIDMTNGPQGNLNADGHPRSARYFWKRMLEEAPHMLSDENKANIRAGRHVEIKVDETWIKYNPTTEKFKGDQLIHHHIDQGSVASAMPQTPHKKLSRLLHSRITGGRIKGGNNMLGIVNIYGLFKDFFGNDPHDLNMQYSSGNKLNTLYFDIESNLYFNITDVFQSPNGRVSLKYDTYESYSYDSEDDRYIGVGFKETRIRVQEKNGRFINDYKEIKN